MSGDQLSQLRDDRISQGPWVCRTIGDETRLGVPGFMKLKLMEPGGYIHLGCPCTQVSGGVFTKAFLNRKKPYKNGTFSENPWHRFHHFRKTAADPPSMYAEVFFNDDLDLLFAENICPMFFVTKVPNKQYSDKKKGPGDF